MVTATPGGAGGGASLTPFGAEVTMGTGRPGSELGLLSGSPVSAFHWCREVRLADRARSAPGRGPAATEAHPASGKTTKSAARHLGQCISPPTGEPISIDNKLR